MVAFAVASLPLIVLALACAVFSYAANGWFMPLYERYALARPNARSSHKTPTPQGGGAGVLLAMLTGLLLYTLTAQGVALRTWGALSIAIAAMALGVVGALDDIAGLGVRTRLLAQFAACALVFVGVWSAHDESARILLMALPVLLPGLVWFVNLTNFMDGIDGISVAEFVPIGAAIAVLGIAGAANPADGAIGAALAGSLTGFAPYNRHIARLFLGDVGSLSIGIVAGTLLLRLALGGHPAAAMILPAYYVADASITLLRRLARGENVTEAHRGHYYQHALDRGWSVPAVTQRLWLTNGGLALIALASVMIPHPSVQIAVLLVAVVVVWNCLRALSRKPAK